MKKTLIVYITERDYYLYLSIAPFLIMLFSTATIKKTDLELILASSCLSLWVLYGVACKLIYLLFKKRGKRYNGRIIRAEASIRAKQFEKVYYLFIEFNKDGKWLIRRTAAYKGNPNTHLESVKCSVYEYMGKYLEGDFNVRRAFPKNKKAHLGIKIEDHKFLSSKGNKYV